MSEGTEKTYTQAEVDAVVAEAKSAQDAKNRELLAELRQHKKFDIADYHAEQAAREKAEAENSDLKKQIAALTKERDGFAKVAQEAQSNLNETLTKYEINKLADEHGVIPALKTPFEAMIMSARPTVEFVDGKPSFNTESGPLGDYVASIINGETGKHLIAAPNNTGGGATGGKGNGGGVKQISRSEYNNLPISEQAAIGLAMAKGEYSWQPDQAA